jgi:hypothetical protein
MPIDFSRLLSEEARAELAAERHELARLHALEDPWLAAELLRLGRRARQAAPDKLGCPTNSGYENALAWSVIPDLACRLSPMLRAKLVANEGQDPWLIGFAGERYREQVYIYLNNSALYSWGHRKEYRNNDAMALRLLGNTAVNGNPIAMALDRIYPPEQCQDPLAKAMRSMSARRCHDQVMSSWSPAFNISYYHRDQVTTLEEMTPQA